MNHLEIHAYTAHIQNWEIASPDQFKDKIDEKGLAYELGISTQLENDPEWCVFCVSPVKEAFNSQGDKIVNLKIQFAFKIKEHGYKLTTDLLFSLLKIAHKNFLNKFREKTRGTHIEHLQINQPKFEYLKTQLEIVISGQGISVQ